MYKLELTEQEATVLGQLIDLAVKANGLQVAEASIILVKKLQASKVVEEPKVEEQQPLSCEEKKDG